MLPAKVSEHLIFWRFRALWPSGSWSVWLSSGQHFILLLSIVCFHYNLFSLEIIPLHGTIFYRKSVYVLWIYICCHYKGTIRWSVLLISFCPLPGVGVRCSEASLYVARIPDTRNSSHLKQTALCPQRKCLTRKLFKGYFAYFLPCFYRTSDVDIF